MIAGHYLITIEHPSRCPAGDFVKRSGVVDCRMEDLCSEIYKKSQKSGAFWRIHYMVDMVDVLTLIIATLGLFAIYINLIQKIRRERNIEFSVQRVYEPTKKPINSDWLIRILHPNKPIERCSVLYNGDLIPWSNENPPSYERRIEKMGAANVRVPKEKEKEDAEIKIQNNNKTLKKVKFKDLLKSK